MSRADDLKLEDAYGRKLFFGTFAGQITVCPLVPRVGDEMALSDEQARELLVFLQKHVPPEPRFRAE